MITHPYESVDDEELLPERAERTTLDPRAGRWRRRLRRLGLVALVLTFTGTLGVVAATYLIGTRLRENVNRISGAFSGIDPAERPSGGSATVNGQTILAVGSDLRSAQQSTGRDATDEQSAESDQRTDAIMLIRFHRTHRSASVISIPRDSWVPIPGHGNNKINAAFPLGGPPLLIRTVEQLTKIRVDHFMIIDFTGFRSIVDVLGGVDVQFATATSGAGGVEFPPGTHRLNGEEALAYVRERHSLPEGDLDRVRRQQNFLRALFTQIARTNPADDPVQLYRLLDAITRSVTVDDGYTPDELRELALDGARLKPQNLWYLTAAVQGVGWEGEQSVVYLDPSRNTGLWEAVRSDSMAAYVAAHPSDLLPATPR